MKLVLKKITQVLDKYSNAFILHLIYTIGIGLAHIIIQLIKPDELHRTLSDSSWSKPSGSDNPNTMF